MELSFSQQLNSSLFFRTGTKNKCRTISIQEMKYLKNDIDINLFHGALVGLYAYTGCDTVSAFSGQGKIKAMKLMASAKVYADLFSEFGRTWDIPD